MKKNAKTKTKKAVVFLPFVFLFSFFACQKDQNITINTDLGYEYFPIKTGHYIIYEVDSIVINDFTAKTDTFQYQLMEIQESEFIDNENRTAQRIERYKRLDSISGWKIVNVCNSCRTGNRAEKVENNIKVVKLTFPVKEGLKWNGNAYNNKDAWNYIYKNINLAQTINGITFDSTVSIIQKDEFNLIESQYYEEKYAKNVGLIYKKVEDIKTEINGKVKSGISYSQQVREYGLKN